MTSKRKHYISRCSAILTAWIVLAIVALAPLTVDAIELPFSLFGGNRNVILIVPDGCSVSMWASIRAMTVGTNGTLNVDKLPVQSRCRTYSADAMITDSAAAGTAYACGVKTRNGVLGMGAITIRGDSLSGKPLETLLETAAGKGYATGIVSTASVLHATPAAFYSHRPERDWYGLIAGDLAGSGIDVIMGGGREYMLPTGTVGPENEMSKRKDSRNIIDEMRKTGYVYIQDRIGFDSWAPEKNDRLLGIFNPGHMTYEIDRMQDKNGEPALWEMTEKALDLLSKKNKGFFLLVEAARIDHAAHDHDSTRFLWEGIACDKTVGVAADFADKHKNTLVIVVPDHGTGGPHLVGLYNTDGGDSTLVSYSEAGFPRYTLDENGFPVRDNGKPVALQWVDWDGHTGEDVGLFAMGPGSEKLHGLVQNTDIYTVMARHLGLIKGEEEDISDTIDY